MKIITLPCVLGLLLTTSTSGQSATFITTTAASTSSETQPATTTLVSLTPAMSAASASSFFAALASVSPQQPGDGEAPGEGNPNDVGGDSDAGASGQDTESITLSTGAIIAIVVIVGAVVIIGITTATLWYFAKKRSWEIRVSIRKSARRVATALTPRRSTFPREVRRSKRFSKGMARIEELPMAPPRMRGNDVEKPNVRISTFDFDEPEGSTKKGWGSKFGRY